MQWTEEQQAIINGQGHLIRIDAYAGTGKTSTLEGRARANPRVGANSFCHRFG